MQKYNTFAEVKKNFKVEKWFHAPWHFSQSGQYVCFLSGNKECYKWDGVYIVTDRR